jgi:hypothetical protein
MADSVRTLAINHNRTLLQAKEEIKAAHDEQRAAFTNFLPKLSAMGTYMYNQKEVSILSGKQKQSLNHLGDRVTDAIKENLGPLANALTMLDIATPLNALGHEVTNALRTDTRQEVGRRSVGGTTPLCWGQNQCLRKDYPTGRTVGL